MAQGKGILQPHHLIDELESSIGDGSCKKHLRDGPFGQILQSTQVCLLFILNYSQHAIPPLPIYSVFFYQKIDVSRAYDLDYVSRNLGFISGVNMLM